MGKSFFLHDLLTKVIFAEAGWVSINMSAVRRALALRTAAFGAIALARRPACSACGGSASRATPRSSNRREAGFDNYAAAATPLIRQTSVNDPDVRPVYELIGALPPLPYGYDNRDASTPLKDTFGLSERGRVQDASVTAYQTALERLMRPRLVLSLEQQIAKSVNDPTYIYEALKVYLMLGHKAPSVDKALVLDWFTRMNGRTGCFPARPTRKGRALLRASSQGDARHGYRRAAEGVAERPAGRAGAGDAWRACASRSAPIRF